MDIDRICYFLAKERVHDCTNSALDFSFYESILYGVTGTGALKGAKSKRLDNGHF